MRTFHTGGVAGLDITAGLPRVEELFEARVPKGKAEISHIDGIVEIIRERHRDEGQGRRAPRSTTPRSAVPKGAEMLAAAGDSVEANQVVARDRRQDKDGRLDRRRGSRSSGFLVKGDDGLVRPGRGRRRARVHDPPQRQAARRERPGDPGRRRDHGRPDQPAGVPRHPGQGRRPALPGQGSPEGLPEPGRHDQRQAHRDHRPADAPQGPHRPAGRRRPAADRADRPPRLRGGRTTGSWPRAASRRRPRPSCSA